MRTIFYSIQQIRRDWMEVYGKDPLPQFLLLFSAIALLVFFLSLLIVVMAFG